MRLGGFGRRQTELLHLFGAEQVLPIAVSIPLFPVQFAGVLDAFAAVAALKVGCSAIFVAAPADAFGFFGMDGEFLGHVVLWNWTDK